jgi:ADP-ribose pyrophosphatase YjhB (NUDIX family)
MSKTVIDSPCIHPKKGSNGEDIVIHRPSQPSGPETWQDANLSAVFIPNGSAPTELNGIPLEIWKDIPQTQTEWDDSGLLAPELNEPSAGISHLPWASGIVTIEPDGRIWMVSPTNRFGGYETTFPKGKLDKGHLSLQANAVKECFEESGLKVRITGFLGDFKRTTSITRLYLGQRVGGDPTDMGWESQAVSLVPKWDLKEHLKNPSDLPVQEKLSAYSPSLTQKDIILGEFGLTSGHRILATISGYRHRFHHWPTKILMSEGVANGIKESILTPLGWRMLNSKITLVLCDLPSIYAEGPGGRFEYGDHTHLNDKGEDRPDIWIWGINLTDDFEA